ncbi:hypothetical protein [Cumulibacter manganitolerans]|uniref:hypothetical protein n=1 Tax=Cumulibacter manganitolerans TaxID=1884992 RepID=UPI001295661D|nr:hypothetical protein [Cumulibacter manganitolerans]
MAEGSSGVVVPLHGTKRSSSALGREVVSAALGVADPVGSRAALRETDWRRQYGGHFRRLVEAGLDDADAAVRMAQVGLDAVHDRMTYIDGEGERSLREAMLTEPVTPLTTAVVEGRGTAETQLSIPFRGRRLAGDELHAQLDTWLARGSMEPSAADAVRQVMAHPEWLSLPGRTMVVLGAASEMGPLQSLLRWGATVAAVDLPRREIWRTTVDLAKKSAGTLLVPVGSEGPIEDRAGADLLHDLPAVGRWIADIDGPLVLGNYVYADGVVNLRLAAAVDAMTAWLIDRCSAPGDLALAFLATPTDVFGVPRETVEFSERAYNRPGLARVLRTPVRFLSGGRLLKRNYAPGSDPGLNDSRVSQQGPNYLLAKRIQRWRATTARRAGLDVSMLVAPPTRTRSVLKNRALAAAYAGAHRFGVEVFSPPTSNTLMAALMVHDLYAGRPQPREPWREEAAKAVHGGLWRGPYDPRSALGIALVLGIGRNRS